MTTSETERLAHELAVYAARLIRLIRRNAPGRTSAATRVMSVLDEAGPSTISALAQADHTSQPTMTGLVNGMVERGWLSRTPHPTDSRSVLVALTAAGRDQLADIRQGYATFLAERVAASGHTTADLETTVTLLRDLLAGGHTSTPTHPEEERL